MTDPISSTHTTRRLTEEPSTEKPTATTLRYIELDPDELHALTPAVCTSKPEKTTLYVDGISPDDIRQGEVGDCTLQASLASLARTIPGKAFLKGRIAENRDATGNVTSYTVSLFKRNAAGGFEPAKVNVPARCLASSGFAHAVSSEGAVEVWPRVFEQAMLMVNGKACDNMPDAMGILTGKPATDIRTSDATLEGKVIAGFGKGKVQVLSTTGAIASAIENPKLKPNHAYTLAGVEAHALRQADGSYKTELLFIVRNPWGHDQPRPMTLDEVKRYFSVYSEGDVP